MRRLFFFRDYLSERFGEPLQRIPFDLGLSCPNRAADGSGGCAFCPPDGSRARHLTGKGACGIAEQAALGKRYVLERYGSRGPYIAYFQAFTGTNAPVGVLRKLYSEALASADFKVVIIATRPDCVSDECADFLAELSEKYELWVELGVQTANDATLESIGRGHNFAAVADCAKRLSARSINCAAQVVLGLPGESKRDYLDTAAKLAALPFKAVKIHNLLILKNTRMEKMFRDGLVAPLDQYEYAVSLADFLAVLPEKTIIMRLTAEADADSLAVPEQKMKKGAFLEMFKAFFAAREKNPDASPAVATADGSMTFYSPEYGQHYHSLAGAASESWKKYIEPCAVREKLERGQNVSVLEIGFGLGFNMAALDALVNAEPGKGSIRAVSLECDRGALARARLLPGHPDAPMLAKLAENGGVCHAGLFDCELVVTDARKYIPPSGMKFDAVFLDGFSPDKNPELWTIDFIAHLKSMLSPAGGVVASYSSAYPFIGALLENGFDVRLSPPFGRKRGGTAAFYPPSENSGLEKLPEKDYLIAVNSTAGTPYRDPGLDSDRKTIFERRVREVAALRAKGVPKWFKG